MNTSYKRVILKLSGEALGVDGKLFCHEKFDETAQMLIEIQKTGVQLAVVIGGGNVWRGRRGASTRMGTVAADQMGMLGTLQNCLYMRDALARAGAKARVVSAVDIPRFADIYNTPNAISWLSSGDILLLACGLGNPCCSTDSAVVLRAIELECDAILMAKNIDGVYTADPHVDPSATMIRDISYADAAEQQLGVMDASAFIMLRENHFPCVRVFGLEPPQNVHKVLQGDLMGTVLHP